MQQELLIAIAIAFMPEATVSVAIAQEVIALKVAGWLKVLVLFEWLLRFGDFPALIVLGFASQHSAEPQLDFVRQLDLLLELHHLP